MEKVVRAVDTGRRNVKYIARGDPGEWRCSAFPARAIARETVPPADSLGPRRRTAFIPVDGLFYEVGPDVHLASDVFNAEVLLHDGYTSTPEYRALTLGALHFMQEEVIDLLMVGLPVVTHKLRKIVLALEKTLTGVHKLGGKRQVEVRKVRVLPQPAGALMQLGVQQNRLAELRKQKNLIIDVGYRTFDWIVTDGMATIDKRSHSLNRGMFDVLQAIAHAISDAKSIDYRDYDAIDRALRDNSTLSIYQSDYAITRHLPIARKICEHAAGEMLRYVGDPVDIANIIVVGGASFFFKKTIAQAFPRHALELPANGLYADVLGFQAAGVELARIPTENPPLPGAA